MTLEMAPSTPRPSNNAHPKSSTVRINVAQRKGKDMRKVNVLANEHNNSLSLDGSYRDGDAQYTKVMNYREFRLGRMIPLKVKSRQE